MAGLLFALARLPHSAMAGQSVSLILNWTPAADHAADHSPFLLCEIAGLVREGRDRSQH